MPAGAFEATLYCVVVPGMAGLVLLVVGIGLLRHGHLIGLLPALASTLPAAVFPRLFASRRPRVEANIAELLREVNEVLGSTAEW
jgi:hypothetical protein